MTLDHFIKSSTNTTRSFYQGKLIMFTLAKCLYQSHFSRGEITMERIVVREDMTPADVAVAVRKIIIKSKFS